MALNGIIWTYAEVWNGACQACLLWGSGAAGPLSTMHADGQEVCMLILDLLTLIKNKRISWQLYKCQPVVTSLHDCVS